MSEANAMRLCAVGLLLLLSITPDVIAQNHTPNNDVPIQLRLEPDKKTIMLGEPLFIAFEVTNLSGEKLCLGVGGDYRNRFGRPERFKVLVRTDAGVEVPQPEVSNGGGFIGCAPIEPGDTYTVRLFLPHWATIERPGSYRVNVKRSMGFSNYEPSDEPKYSMLADLDTEFTVVPADENKMGAVINLLGSVMLDSSNPASAESAQALASIHDKRTISYFAEAVRKFSDYEFGFEHQREQVISSRSIGALGTYDDDRAIEALQAVMNSPSEDTRLSVAIALGESPHKSAMKLPVLQKLLKDENEDVRKAAKVSLEKINH